MTDTDREAVAALAATHGVDIDPATIRFVEAGLDYRVAIARHGADGWVLRIPRRPDVVDRIAPESRVLDFVGPRLPVAVPDWRVRDPELIAYPLLPGEPGLTIDPATGGPVWHFDRESPGYARSLGRLIAALHLIDPDEAAAAGVPVFTPAEIRAEWRANVHRVEDRFEVAPHLREAWATWLADDALWPDRCVLTHGELYPAHLLLGPGGDSEPEIHGVLDWTTARVADPAVDFMYHYMMSSPATFDVALAAYAEAGAQVPERLADRCAAILAAGPVNYAIYALQTGDPDHAAAAAAQLNPAEEATG